MVISSLSELNALAKDLCKQVAGGQLWCFSGELGAGKTELIRQMLSVLSPGEKVTSPSYNLENRYPFSDLTIAHWDLYRLRNLTNLPDLEEQIGDARMVILVEWPERLPGLSDFADFQVEIKFAPGTQNREIAIATKPKKF